MFPSFVVLHEFLAVNFCLARRAGIDPKHALSDAYKTMNLIHGRGSDPVVAYAGKDIIDSEGGCS